MKYPALLALALIAVPLRGDPMGRRDIYLLVGDYQERFIGGAWNLKLKQDGMFELESTGTKKGTAVRSESGTWRLDGALVTLSPSSKVGRFFLSELNECQHLYWERNKTGATILVSYETETPSRHVFELVPNQPADPAQESGTHPAGQESRHP
jgi:hypothetical protein